MRGVRSEPGRKKRTWHYEAMSDSPAVRRASDGEESHPRRRDWTDYVLERMRAHPSVVRTSISPPGRTILGDEDDGPDLVNKEGSRD